MSVEKLVKAAVKDEQPALALTDTNNLFGGLEFAEKCWSAGIQPITGVQLHVDFAALAVGDGKPKDTRAPLVLLAQNAVGYQNLIALASKAYLDVPANETPHVSVALLAEYAGGLIALSGGVAGGLDAALRNGRADEALARMRALQAAFGDRFYIELNRLRQPNAHTIESELLDMAYAHGVPIVASNACSFAAPDDFEAQDALLAIADGETLANENRRHISAEAWFKPRSMMATVFADLPEALANTVEIAQRCTFRLGTRKPMLPRFVDISTGDIDVAEAVLLSQQAHEGLSQRIATHGLSAGLTEPDYRARLDFELGVISRMKFPGYFLIVSDFIKWAKAQDIPVGPGRGSGAGSLVAYSLMITDLDPIRFGLLFERFLNPDRVSMPDFDIDFCQDRREEVIAYVQEKYGHERVAQIITFGTLQARGVMRDVGRVLEMPYGQVDRLCKLVPNNPAAPVTLAQAVDGEPRLQEAADEEPVVRKMLDIALKLEGLHRHASTHAAGIVIGDRSLSELVPMYRDPRSTMPVTQFNMKWVEQAGLVKFDFLGLKTLSVMQAAVQLLEKRGVALNLATLPLDNPATYTMLAKGETVGVFQLESAGMRKAITDMKPDRLEDIIALVALYRPGPMANIPTYNARKHGLEAPDYIHPMLQPYLQETFGVIIYQEQVMQIAQAMGGYSLGEADLLRRAMGKKIKKEMEQQRERFVKGALEKGIAKKQASTIFDLLAKFADYGFNKSHAAAYALVAYQTAYLKANYPVEFLAASMTYEMHDTDKLSDFKREANRLTIPVMAPSVNSSRVRFDVEEGKICYAFAALKGLGEGAAEAIVQGRGHQPYASIADFVERLPPKQVNKRAVETLAAAGAFEDIEPSRALVYGNAERIIHAAHRTHEQEALGVMDMFGASPSQFTLTPQSAWLPAEKLQKEFDAIGFYLSGHPLDAYQNVIQKLHLYNWRSFGDMIRRGGEAGKIAATVLDMSERRTKTGNKMGIVSLSDPTGTFEVVMFQEKLAQLRDMFKTGATLVLSLEARVDGEDVRASISGAELLDAAAARVKRAVSITLNDMAALPKLQALLQTGGEAEVSLTLQLYDVAQEVELKLPRTYHLPPAVLAQLSTIAGVAGVVE